MILFNAQHAHEVDNSVIPNSAILNLQMEIEAQRGEDQGHRACK